MSGQVLILSNMFPSKKHKTFGIFIKKQVDQLKKMDWKTHVIAISNPRSEKIYVVTKYLLWVLRSFFHVLFLGHRYDVVHAHYVFPSGIFGLMAKKLWHRRLVVTVHGGDIDRMARKNKYIFKCTKYILQKADHVICVGGGLYQDLRQDFEVDDSKLSVISMGVDQSIFFPADNRNNDQEHGNSGERLILFVGNMLKEKGVLELIKAFQTVHSNYPNTRLHLVGAIKQQSFFDEINEEIMRNGLKENVVYHGVLRPEEVAYWMNASDMLVLPSWMEGFGLVALEAMSCGTPVIGSDVGGLSLLLDGDCGLKVPSKDQKRLAEAIKELFENRDFRNKLIQNGYIKARENSNDNVLEKVIAIYRGETLL